MSTTAAITLDDWRRRLDNNRVKIETVIPDKKLMTVDRFVQQALIAMSKNPAIMSCDTNSVFHSVFALASLGLDPSGNLGSGYLVPFKGVCTPVPGYRGLIDLAVRSAEVKGIKAELVFWGDEFDIEEGDRPRLWHKPKLPQSKEEEAEFVDFRRWDNVRGAYAVAKLPGGHTQFTFMPFRDLEVVRARAPGGNSAKTPWAPESSSGSRMEMYKKTPIRRICKQLPLSPVKATLLLRAIDMDDENEKLVASMGPETDNPEAEKKRTGADKLREALKAKDPEPEDAQVMDTDQYAAIGPVPPDDVKLPTK
jgi:recombination protein RecT